MAALDLAVQAHTAGDGAHLADLEGLADLKVGHNLLLRLGGEHTLDSVFELVDGVVDDAVEADVDVLGLGHLAGTHGGTHLEADDDGVGRHGQHDVVLRYLTHGLVDDVDLHLVGTKLDERVAEGLHGAVHVTLDDDVELFEVAEGATTTDFLEGEVGLRTDALLTLQLGTFGGDVLGFFLVLHDVEGVASLAGTSEAEEQHRLRRTGGHDLLVALVVHGADASGNGTSHDGVALAERAFLHQQFGNIAAAFVERALDDHTLGALVGVALKLHDVGLEDDFLEQFLNADTFLGADVLALVFTAPLLDEEVHVSQLGLDAVGVGTGFINLVDGKDDGHAGRLGVVDSLDGLRHDLVVGGDDDDGDIRHLGTAGTHGGEGLVTGGVEEGDLAAVGGLYLVSTDVLGDTARLAGDDVGLADIVEQRGLTVVDVTHDGDDGVAGHEVFGIVLFLNLVDGVHHVLIGEVHLEAELVGDELDGLSIEALVDAHEDADAHAGGDDLGHRHVHHGSQLVGGDEFGYLQHVLVLHLVEHLLLHLGVHLLALLAVMLGGLGLAHGGEAGEGVAYLFLDLVVVNLYGLFVLFLFLLLAGGSLLLGGVLLAVLAGFLLLLALLLGYLGANLLHLLGADGLFLGVLAFALATGGVGTVLAELAEVNLVEDLGAFELGVLCLDEFGLRLGRLDGFGSFNGYGLCFRLWCGRGGLFHDNRSTLLGLGGSGGRYGGLALLSFLVLLLVGTHALVYGAQVHSADHLERAVALRSVVLFVVDLLGELFLGHLHGLFLTAFHHGLRLYGHGFLGGFLVLFGLRLFYGFLYGSGFLGGSGALVRGEAFDDHLFGLGFGLGFGTGFNHTVAACRHEFYLVGLFLHPALAIERCGQQFILLLANLRVGALLHLVPLLGKVFHEGLDAHVEILSHLVQSETCHILSSPFFIVYSNSARSTSMTWSMVSSSRSVRVISSSLGRARTLLAVSQPILMSSSIIHWSISSLNSCSATSS